VSYQDYPCAKGTEMTDASEFTPERVPAYRPPPRTYVYDPPSSRGAASGAHVPIEPKTSACEAAKSHREQSLRQVGLRRTFDLLQRLESHAFLRRQPVYFLGALTLQVVS
jgi:hypothetical protein